MSYPIGGDFLPNPRKGTAMDFFYEKAKEGTGATREFIKELNAARGWEAKVALIKDLKVKRDAKKAGYIGQVEISINLDAVQIQFDLQKQVAEEDWPDWKEMLRPIEAIIDARRVNGLTVVFELGNYYRDRTRATIVAQSAAELLHLSTGTTPIKYTGGE